MKKVKKASFEELDQLTSSKLKDVTGGKSNTGTKDFRNSTVGFTIANQLPPLNGISYGRRF